MNEPLLEQSPKLIDYLVGKSLISRKNHSFHVKNLFLGHLNEQSQKFIVLWKIFVFKYRYLCLKHCQKCGKAFSQVPNMKLLSKNLLQFLVIICQNDKTWKSQACPTCGLVKDQSWDKIFREIAHSCSILLNCTAMHYL